MPLFRPNLNCQIRRRTGANAYGEETLSTAVDARCSVIKLKRIVSDSSVRADSSASRGASKEYQIEGKLLLPFSTVIAEDDQIIVNGLLVRVMSIFQRHNLQGVPDHLEVEVVSWGKP